VGKFVGKNSRVGTILGLGIAHRPFACTARCTSNF
jgi:hypothetical protein